MAKNFKYVCWKCRVVRSAKIELTLNPIAGTAPIPKEVVRSFTNTDKRTGETKVFTGRQLECNHFIAMDIPAFVDHSTENLNEMETNIIRINLDKLMIGKTDKEIQETILFQVDQYNTLLRMASKQKQQARYAIQQLEQLKDRYKKQLGPEEQQSLEMRFAHFLDLKPTTSKTVDREKKEAKSSADQERDDIEAVKALLTKKGFDPSKAFKKLAAKGIETKLTNNTNGTSQTNETNLTNLTNRQENK